MRARFFIALIIIAIIGSGHAMQSADAAQEIHLYWKPPKPFKLAIMGSFGVTKDAREVPLEAQNPNDTAYNIALDSIKHKKFGKAIAEFDRLLQRNRSYADAYFGRGLAYALEGKYAPAVADFTQFLKIDPKDADAYCNRGLARVLQGQCDQGLADLNKSATIWHECRNIPNL
jgi:tetratricopeptide (TPR) repeat protein